MDEVQRWAIAFSHHIAWAAGGLVLLIRYHRHPRACRRGLAAVAVWLGLFLPLNLSLALITRTVPQATGWDRLVVFRLWQWAYFGCQVTALLLLAWAAVTDRRRPAEEE